MTSYDGRCILRALFTDWCPGKPTDIRIERADERIMVSDVFLDILDARGCLGEGVFVIKAVNGTARYALQRRDPDRHHWTARRIGPDPSGLADGAET